MKLQFHQNTSAATPLTTPAAAASGRLLLYLALIALVPVAYQHLLVTGWGLPSLPVTEAGVAIFVALFSLLHSLSALGWRNTLALFGITAVVGWSFEQAGVATGLIYGMYHYSDALGPKLGHVPYAIPIAWYSMLYISYQIAQLITQGSPRRTQSGWAPIAWQAGVAAMVMTAWDVLVDPLASGPSALSWVWEQGGAYYGVPTQNFVGWMLTGFTVVVCYRLYQRFAPARPLARQTRTMLALPLLVYGLIMVQMMVRHDAPTEWPVLAAFVMGFPLVAASSQLFRGNDTTQAETQ
jgi:putative membrane protein